jgi:DNA-directed RNA polymerase subunit M/transcription elongation factor TFIIS
MKELEVGQDIEAYCTSCRMDLNHVIVAKKDGEVKRVRCLTCEKEHNYRPPKGESAKTKTKAKKKSTTAKKTNKKKKTTRRTKTKEERLEQAWIDAVGQDRDVPARAYEPTEAFTVGELIQHATFGLGSVQEVYLTGKMEVIFRTGVRLLACRRMQMLGD